MSLSLSLSRRKVRLTEPKGFDHLVERRAVLLELLGRRGAAYDVRRRAFEHRDLKAAGLKVAAAGGVQLGRDDFGTGVHRYVDFSLTARIVELDHAGAKQRLGLIGFRPVGGGADGKATLRVAPCNQGLRGDRLPRGRRDGRGDRGWLRERRRRRLWCGGWHGRQRGQDDGALCGRRRRGRRR